MPIIGDDIHRLFDTMVETWESALGDQPWIMGEDFTAADVMLGSSAVFLRMFGMLPESAALEAYADRCAERPAFVRSMEKSAG